MSPSAARVVPQKVNFWGQGNKEGSPRLPLGEERTNILLLACCYQEGSNPKALFNFGVALVTGLLFGLVPALQATKPDVAFSLSSQTLR